MQRSPVHVRDALPEDASALLDAWFESLGGAAPAEDAPNQGQVATAVARIVAEPAERLVVGIVDNAVAGVAYFRRAAITPIHDEDAVHVSHLHVRRSFRRRGVTKALLAEAALWSEEKDSRHVLVTAAARSRDFHRFLARLGLTQVAVVRGSTTASLRLRLAAAQASSGAAPLVVTRRSMGRRRAGRRGIAAASGTG